LLILRADAAYVILTSDKNSTTGNFFIDDEVLASIGVVDLDKYKVSPSINEKELMPDYFCWNLKNYKSYWSLVEVLRFINLIWVLRFINLIWVLLKF